MNPGEVKASKKSEKENKDDAKNSRHEKKKQKLPTGLALMHGFSSTSVGKSRLTVRSTELGIRSYLISRSLNRPQLSEYLTRAKPPQR
jgi:hypothetical protein